MCTYKYNNNNKADSGNDLNIIIYGGKENS